MTMETLPLPLLSDVFVLSQNAEAFSQTSHTLRVVSFDSLSRAKYLLVRYGPYLSLPMAALRHPKILSRPVARALITNGAIISRHFAQRLLRNHDGGYRPISISASTITHILDHAINTYGDFAATDDDRKVVADLFCQIMNSEEADKDLFAAQTRDLDTFLTRANFYPIPEIVYYADSVDVRHSHFYKSCPYEALLLLISSYSLPFLTRIVQQGYHIRHEHVQRFFSQFCLAVSVFRYPTSRASAALTSALQKLIDLRAITLSEDDIYQLIVHDMRQESVHVAGTLGHLSFGFSVQPIFERVVLEIMSDPQSMSWEKGFRRLYETMPCRDVMARALLKRFADVARLVIPAREGARLPVARRKDLDFGFGLTREFVLLVLQELGPVHLATRVVFAKLLLGIVAAGGEDYDPYGEKLGERLRLMQDMMEGGLWLTKRYLKWFAFASNGNSLREFLAKIEPNVQVLVDEAAEAEAGKDDDRVGIMGGAAAAAEFVFTVARDGHMEEGVMADKAKAEGGAGTDASVDADPTKQESESLTLVSAIKTTSPKTRPFNVILAEILAEERDRQRHLVVRGTGRRGARRRPLVARDMSKNPLIEVLSERLGGEVEKTPEGKEKEAEKEKEGNEMSAEGAEGSGGPSMEAVGEGKGKAAEPGMTGDEGSAVETLTDAAGERVNKGKAVETSTNMAAESGTAAAEGNAMDIPNDAAEKRAEESNKLAEPEIAESEVVESEAKAEVIESEMAESEMENGDESPVVAESEVVAADKDSVADAMVDEPGSGH